MKKALNQISDQCKFIQFPNCIKHTLILLLILMSFQIVAQQEVKPRSFGIHAGLNSGFLSGGSGPSFSIHYAFRRNKFLQPETKLFYDSHNGRTFLTGGSERDKGVGIAIGIRINLFLFENWNPSLAIMGGAMYDSKITSYDTFEGFSPCISLSCSANFYQNHMLSIGFNRGEFLLALFAQYGYWF